MTGRKPAAGGERLIIHRLASGTEPKDRVEYLFRRVGLSSEMKAKARAIAMRWPPENSCGSGKSTQMLDAVEPVHPA
jgi:hypothetical protein